MQYVLLMATTILWAVGPAPAAAQGCGRATLEGSLAASDAVVSGIVAEARLVGPDLDVVRVDIVPTRVFKGEPADRYVVYTRRPGCTSADGEPPACTPSDGFEFVAGEHYVVFAHTNGRTDPPEIETVPATTLVTNSCTYTTKQFAESSAVVRWLERASRDAR